MKFRRSLILSPFSAIRIYINIGSLSSGVSSQAYYARAHVDTIDRKTGLYFTSVNVSFRGGNNYVLTLPLSSTNSSSETFRNQQSWLTVTIDIDSSNTYPKIDGATISRIDLLN